MEDAESRAEMEERYRLRMEAARAVYAEAKSAVQDARAELHARGLPSPDGSQAYRNALAAENFTRRAYMKALKEFTDLVIGGKSPFEESR